MDESAGGGPPASWEQHAIVIAVAIVCVSIWWYRGKREQERYEQQLTEERARRKALEEKMTVASRDDWTLEELAEFDGEMRRPQLTTIAANWLVIDTGSDDKPILFIAGDKVTSQLHLPLAYVLLAGWLAG